jgi:hypothetical protein
MQTSDMAKARTENASLRKFEQLFAGLLDFQISKSPTKKQGRQPVKLQIILMELEDALAAAGGVQA